MPAKSAAKGAMSQGPVCSTRLVLFRLFILEKYTILLTHVIVEVAEALGGSFKLVTPAPKPVREMTQLLRETQKDRDTQTN